MLTLMRFKTEMCYRKAGHSRDAIQGELEDGIGVTDEMKNITVATTDINHASSFFLKRIV